MRGENMEKTYTVCKDPEMLLAFLRRIDRTLPVPLSERVDLERFAKDSVKGTVYTVEADGEILSAALVIYGYLDKPYAYLNLLATVPGGEGKGFAGHLMDVAEKTARKDGMTEFHLHTNASNTRAVGFYERRGFRIITTEPKLHMAKVL